VTLRRVSVKSGSLLVLLLLTPHMNLFCFLCSEVQFTDYSSAKFYWAAFQKSRDVIASSCH